MGNSDKTLPKLLMSLKKLDASNCVFCAYCGEPLAITEKRHCIGALGITAILIEQERCLKKPQTLFAK